MDLIEAMRLVDGHSLEEIMEENPCEFHNHSDGSERPNRAALWTDKCEAEVKGVESWHHYGRRRPN
jgi:hypothetical protein